jgi:hypothetical protein
MNTDTSIDRSSPVTLSDPTGIAASLPHLLGFHPEESLVCLWLRKGTLVVSQRADLGPAHEGPVEEYVAAFIETAAHVKADAAICVIVTRSDKHVPSLCAAVRTHMSIPCQAILHVRGSQVRMLSTPPGEWKWIDTRSRQWAAHRFLGPTPAFSRTRIETECDADAGACEAMGDFEPGNVSALEHLRGFADAAVRSGRVDSTTKVSMGDQPIPPLDERQLRDALADSRGRDLVLVAAAYLAPADRGELLQSLLRCTRATPPGQAGHSAAAAGVVAWLCGDGVRANVALERCVLDDPDNVLGAVLDHAVCTGVPPEQMRAMLAEIPLLDIVLS